MNAFRLQFLLFVSIVASSTVVQQVLCSSAFDLGPSSSNTAVGPLQQHTGGSNSNSNSNNNFIGARNQGRRHLLQETTCDLILKDIEYEPTTRHPHGYSKEEWVCLFAPGDSSRIGGLQYVDIAGSARINADATDEYGWKSKTPLRSGSSTLTLSSAIVDTSSEGGEPKLYIPPGATVTVGTTSHTLNNSEGKSKNQPPTENTGTNNTNGDESAATKKAKRRRRRRKKKRKKKQKEDENQNQSHKDEPQDEGEDPIPVRDRHRRRLEAPPSMGTLRALVIRVVDRRGTAPDAGIDQLRDDVFEDQTCLKTQFEACSYGKLSIVPGRLGLVASAVGGGPEIHDGVAQVSVDYDVSASTATKEGLQQAALEASFLQFGNLYESPYFDLILYCMPPGTGDWVAYAFVNHKFSFYNNKWCSSVSSQLHEVGHNLGLGHSGEYEWESDPESEGGEDELVYKSYADASGVMGFTYSRDDQQICFNPAKSYQLGWYSDQVTTVNPLSVDEARRSFVLNGVADYRRNPGSALVVLRLEQSHQEPDYYVGYNRKHGIHVDTMEDPDTVTIVRKEMGSPTEYGYSTKVVALNVGDSYVLENFNGEQGKNVEVTFRSLGSDGVDAMIEVADLSRATATSPGPGNYELSPIIPTCAELSVEIHFDRYPTDITWSIVLDDDNYEAETVVASSPEYNQETDKEQTVSTKVCLPLHSTNDELVPRLSWNASRRFRFVIRDSYGDGLCCGQGNGFYEVLDSKGNVVFGGGHVFTTQEHAMTVLPPSDSASGPSVVGAD
eukprot:jgi/Psemu1/37652/gm1.37652_g